MSRTYRRGDRPTWPIAEAFRCQNCRLMVGPPASGGRHRNHCPHCLFSRHVDGSRPGDRAATCGARMTPSGAFARPSGEHVLVHRCLGCGFERYNRIAADDDFELILSLPRIDPRRFGLATRPRRTAGRELIA